MYPTDRFYTREHEWIRFDDGEAATVGITDFAQRQLGDVVFVELPEIGKQLAQGDAFGTIESVKAVSELFSPMTGEVVAVNTDLGTHPEAVNQAPHETWIIKLRPSLPDEKQALLDAGAYADLVK